jgi:hypothetical protein
MQETTARSFRSFAGSSPIPGQEEHAESLNTARNLPFLS